MTEALKRARSVVSIIYDKLGDPRSKNVLIFILLLMTAFGVLDPERATALRDTILKMAL
jgi:hypothetical protein